MSRQGITVEVKDVSKWYGKVVGVNAVSLTFRPGVTGLLGPNGAGKSTLIRLLVGLMRPSKGTVRLDGLRVFNNVPLMRRVGYCPDHDGVYSDLSGLEFVERLARLSGLDRAQAHERASGILERLGLKAAQDRRIGTYSKGMRQRAKLAQSMVHDPDLIVLDEPLTGCDPLARVKITDEIRALGAAGKTVIVSSHILHEVESLTSEIALLYKGQVLADGNVYQIREMIDEHPHQIRVECDQPRKLAAELAAATCVASLSFPAAEVLVVETRAPDSCYPLIPQVAMAQEIKIHSLVSPDNNLQAVFDYLTKDEGARRHRGTQAPSDAAQPARGVRP